jgi:hypothetical protein
MAVRTLEQLTTAIAVISNETTAGANTKTRIAAILQDISDSIESLGETDVTGLINDIAALETAYSSLNTAVSNLDSGKVDKVTGSSLVPDSEISKLAGLSVGNTITTPTLPATTGTLTIVFDGNRYYQIGTQTGNITFASTGVVEGAHCLLVINGASPYTFTFPSTWINKTGNLPGNGYRNRIDLRYTSGQVEYVVSKSTLPDAVAPTFNVKTVTGLLATAATFNAQINEAGNAVWMVTTSSSAPSAAAILAGTGAVGSNYGTISLLANTTGTAALSGLTSSTSYYLWTYAIDAYSNQSTVQAGIDFTTASADVTAPTLVSMATNTLGTQTVLTFSETLASVTPAITDFALSGGKTVTAVGTPSGATITVTHSSAYAAGASITLAYTQGTNKIQDVAGNFAASFAATTVTNNTIAYPADDFNATDVADIAGRTTSVGSKTWSKVAAFGAATLKIASNKLQASTGANACGYVFDAGVRNISISVVLSNIPATGTFPSSSLYILFGLTNENNAFSTDLRNGATSQTVAAAGTAIITAHGTLSVNGDVIRINLNANVITVYRNGVQIGTTSAASTALTGTSIGVYSYFEGIGTIDSITTSVAD